MRICFNSDYYLRNDGKRVILSTTTQAIEHEGKRPWMSRIHPLYAMILAILSMPKEIEEAIDDISDFFGFSNTQASEMIASLIKKEDYKEASFDGTVNYFPGDVLLTDNEIKKPSSYSPTEFIFKEVDVDSQRMILAPNSVLLIINNKCATQCAYCYADKKHVYSTTLSFKKIKSIIDDACALGIREFEIIGGEFFLFPQWEELLDYLLSKGILPRMISTKVPLSDNQIERFSRFNIRLQISLDSVFPKILSDTLKVSDSYAEKIKATIRNIDASGIRYQLATVLTYSSASIKNLEGLYEFIKTLDNLKGWEIRYAFKSLYASVPYENLKVPNGFHKIVSEWYKRIKDNIKCRVDIPSSEKDELYYAEGGSRSFKGARCSANISNMVILPDGNVTICEQLYWNPHYIIGNINSNSIKEIWNSSRAIELIYKQQKSISRKSECSRCKLYDDCFTYANRCHPNILKHYGDDCHDFPDPRCVKASPIH